MESMKKEQLIRELSNYGYDMVSPGAGNPQQVLVQLVQSDDGRILEGFSVVMTNMLQKYPAMDLAATEKQLDRGLQKRYRTLVAITYHLLSLLPDARLDRGRRRETHDARLGRYPVAPGDPPRLPARAGVRLWVDRSLALLHVEPPAEQRRVHRDVAAQRLDGDTGLVNRLLTESTSAAARSYARRQAWLGY